MAITLVAFTRIDNTTVYVNPAQVDFVSAYGATPPTSLIQTSGSPTVVNGSPAAVAAALEA